jgi:hypothetical protein
MVDAVTKGEEGWERLGAPGGLPCGATVHWRDADRPPLASAAVSTTNVWEPLANPVNVSGDVHAVGDAPSRAHTVDTEGAANVNVTVDDVVEPDCGPLTICVLS